MPKITYQALLDGVTDSCALTQPIASVAPEALQPPRRPARTVTEEEVEPANTEATGSVTGSGPQQISNLVVSGNQITGTVTIDLAPYQKALDNLDFSTREDNAFSSTVTSTKFRPSLDSHLGIDGSGNSTYLGDVNGAIYINTDRVIINSKSQHTMMFGQKGVAIASPNRVNIDAGDSITLAAQGTDGGGLFIGLPNVGLSYTSKKQSQIGLSKGDPTADQPYEPLVLGIKLANILEDFLYVLKDIQGVDAFSPVKFQPTTQAEFALLANRIPEMLSSYAYIDGMSHGAIDMDQLATLKEAQAKVQDYIPPKNLTGSFTGQFTVTNGVGGDVGSDFASATQAVIKNFEGGYYHPQMLQDGRVKDQRYANSGETMMGIDRKTGGSLNTSPAGVKFWGIIDSEGAASKWAWNYKGGPREAELLALVPEIMKPAFDGYANSYIKTGVRQIIESDGKLLFHMIYAAWNGPGWFQKFAKDLDEAFTSGITDVPGLLQVAIRSRKYEGLKKGSAPNSLVAQGGEKMEKLFGISVPKI